MPGQFSKTNRPVRPGAYFNFEAQQQVVLPPSLGGIAAVAATNDWGPMGTPVQLDSFSAYRAVFGASTDTQMYRAVMQCFKGEGLPGYGGAGAVLAYRMGTSTVANQAKAATVTLAGTGPGSLDVTARYEGTKGNDLNVTVQPLASDPTTKAQMVVYDGLTQLSSYAYDIADIDGLAAQVNATDGFIMVTPTGAGPLTDVANKPLTGGTDGDVLSKQDYTDMMAGVGTARFSVFGMETPTDPDPLGVVNPNAAAIIASLVQWTKDTRASGQQFMTVIGGPVDELMADAIDRSAAADTEGVVNIGCANVTDVELGPLTMAQLAPRVAGVLAARGEARSLTYARFAGLSLDKGPSDQDILAAFDNGVTVLSRDSNVAAPVRIEKGLTTYITTTDAAKPYTIFRESKFVRTMDGIQMDLQAFAEADVIGKMPVSTSTRNFVRANLGTMLRLRELSGIIQPGWKVEDDNDPPPQPSDDFIAFVIYLTFGRSTEQVYFTARVA